MKNFFAIVRAVMVIGIIVVLLYEDYKLGLLGVLMYLLIRDQNDKILE